MQSAKLQQSLQNAAADLQAGRLEAAARACAQARQYAPRDFTVLNLSGVVALQQERFDDAVRWLSAAAKLKPAAAPCALRLGFALAKLGRHDTAEAALREAVKLAPGDAEAWDTLGYVLKARGRLEEAIAAHRRAVELNPSRANSWYNLGHALLFAGRPGEALASQDRALAADAGFSKAHYGRALALQQCHRIPDAVAAFAEALRAEPGNDAARSYRLMALNYLENCPREGLFAEHANFGAAVERGTPAPFFGQTRQARRRLRLAFLSPDLREHSVAYFLEPLLAHLPAGQFEVVLYHDHFVMDATTERLRAHSVLFRNLVGQPAEAVEAIIRADAPDVLVDLAGHTGLNRLTLFARRLAPVQITYLGYPNTTGLKTMDYRFVDAVTDPLYESESLHTEQLVRFSSTAWAYQPPATAPEISARKKAPEEPVVFGCFNNFAKVTDGTLACWARLLATVPNSRLRLKATGLDEPAIAADVTARLARAGLDPARVDLVARTPSVADHLALYHDIDVALDTFPYHGTTTTCEALWMGVPVVTLAGDRHASRVGLSLLQAIGHPEWVARDREEYLKIAADLARDPAARARLRTGLRAEMRRSPLMNYPEQAARFAAAVRSCWTKWCEANPVTS